MSNNNRNGLVFVLLVVAVYIGIWLWCKLTGEKPEMES
jgi:hypothetical protein